ncbi:MAG: Bax inhibitor-1/YccA family protein [Acidimicrobiales bacterium]
MSEDGCMPNPVLNPKRFSAKAAEAQPGWGAPTNVAPAPDAVSPWPPAPSTYETMTIGGVASATGVLLALLIASAAFGWVATEPETGSIPGLVIGALILSIGLAIATVLKPTWARVTAPLYAIADGFVVGCISHLYAADTSGIVLQAIGLTLGVFLIMLTLFATGRIVVTEKLRMGIVAATGAIFVVYMLSIVAHLFGGDIGFIHDSGSFGIIFSLIVVGIASMNLLLDFDFVQRAVAARVPKQMEWYAAFGLLVTLVWLYLEILRLLAKMQRR